MYGRDWSPSAQEFVRLLEIASASSGSKIALMMADQEEASQEGNLAGAWKPFATKHKGEPSPQSDLVSKIFLQIDQRKWNDILAVDYVSKKRSWPWRVSNIVTEMSRHRADDGAIGWNTLLRRLCRDFENDNAGRWSNMEWLDLLQQGSNNKRLQ